MKISIITATLNSSATLGKMLDSVAGQTAIDDIEHIIVDARSTDNTLGIAAQYPHVCKLLSCKDRGIYHAFNIGVAQSTGDVIYFIGCDDYLNDNSVIEDVLSIFKTQGNIDYLFGRVRFFSDNHNETWVADNSKESFNRAHPNHQGFFCKRTIFDNIGPFNECFSIAADNYMMKKVMRDYLGLHSKRIIACFNDGGISSCDMSKCVLDREFKAINLLLNNEDKNREVELNKNISDLKSFIEKVISPSGLGKYKNSKIAIFGVREMSKLISRALGLVGAETKFFLTSNKPDDFVVEGLSVYSIRDAASKVSELNFVINCIEGPHESDISRSILELYPDLKIISWRNL